MLFTDGYALALVAIVFVLAIASVIALFSRPTSGGVPASAYVLSDNVRATLESLKLEARRRAQLSRKQRKRKGR